MSRPWMPLYVADYLRDTRRLTAAEHGAYLLLIMEYWTTGTLPDDDRQLSRIACMTPPEWRRARPNVQVFFQDGWTHKRIDVELARAADISSKRSASAKLKHSKSSAIAEQMDTHAGATSQSQSQESSLRSETAPAKPKATRAKPKHPLPDLWQMDDQDFNYATDQGFKPDKIRQMSRAFVDHHRAKATLSADWHASWRTWCANEIKFNGGGNGNRTGNQKTSGHDAILAVAARKARELDRHDDMAWPADEAGFAFGDGTNGSGPRGNSGAAGSDRSDHQRLEPDDKRIREGEIIPPDKNAAGVPSGREFI